MKIDFMMWICLGTWGVYAVLALLSMKSCLLWLKNQEAVTQGQAIAAAGLWIADRLRLQGKMPEITAKVYTMQAALYGQKEAGTRTKLFFAQIVIWTLAAWLAAVTLAWVAANAELIGVGAAALLVLPVLLYKRLSGEINKRKRMMLLELPEVLNRFLLLVNAGDTVTQGLIRMTAAKVKTSGAIDHPLWRELERAARALEVNASFAKVMEEFSKRCAFQEASLFTTTLLLNYRRGGDDLVISLRELSLTLWERRKSLVKTMGEEASAKLVFPMVIIFFAVIVVVAAPALLMMNGA